MERQNFGKIIIREIMFMASSGAAAFGIGRLIPTINSGYFSIKLAAMFYFASIIFRIAGLFIGMTLKVAFMLGLVAVGLLFLAARYPDLFAFLK